MKDAGRLKALSAATWMLLLMAGCAQKDNGAVANGIPAGQPNLSGLWITPDGTAITEFLSPKDVKSDFGGGIAATSRDGSGHAIAQDSHIEFRSHVNKPMYRPEFWSRVREYDRRGSKYDPRFYCKPLGVPRMGPPKEILQTPTHVVLLYANVYPSSNTYRYIPVDGRAHHPDRSVEATYLGDSIGRFEGDTLIVETVGIIEDTWLGWTGYFHSKNLKVTERFRRVGERLSWQATVEDPEVLLEPWTMDEVISEPDTDPDATIFEEYPCLERDAESMDHETDGRSV